MMEAEDARGNGPAGLRPLEEGLASSNPDIQRLAVRGVGRLERLENLPLIVPLLSSSHASVRAEAVNALGQAVWSTNGDGVADLLLVHIDRETDPVVRGVVARTLGRLAYADSARSTRAEEAIVQLTLEGGAAAPLPTLTGAVLGLESMSRIRGTGGLASATVVRLRTLAALGRLEPGANSVAEARVRRVAMMALSATGDVGTETIVDALEDPDPDVRRLSVRAVGQVPVPPEGLERLFDALADEVARVRVEAARAVAAQVDRRQACPQIARATDDPDTQVAVAAVDLLGGVCDRAVAREVLSGIMIQPGAEDAMGWHRAAHALVALAEVSAEDTREFLDNAILHVSPFARAYAARAAAVIGHVDALETLAYDASANVRTVAVQGLFELRGHAIDRTLIDQLEMDDPLLVMTVAGLLQFSPNGAEAIGPLIRALQRFSEGGRETARDPRVALLDRLDELGGVNVAEDLEPYLGDYDSVVAERVAEILTGWRGQPEEADPRPAPRPAVPTPAEVERLGALHVVLEMERGGEIDIRLLAELAPTNAARFARLAESGYLDGLTFHRVVTNFVLQGGSPGANEFAGDGPYTRDELGLASHWRGTVGLSTRGRDTGDGQLFINLVDNLRLDHDYTIFGEVVRGMDVADVVSEGDVIVRARVVGG